MSESPRDMLSRLKLIASSDRDCDLSVADIKALKWIIAEYEKVGCAEGSSQEPAADSRAQRNNPDLSVRQSSPRSQPVTATEGWQPIETAPKDGTRIRVLRNGVEEEAHWDVMTDTEGEALGGWWWTSRRIRDREHQPTHWKPSAQPVTAKEETKTVGERRKPRTVSERMMNS